MGDGGEGRYVCKGQKKVKSNRSDDGFVLIEKSHLNYFASIMDINLFKVADH